MSWRSWICGGLGSWFVLKSVSLGQVSLLWKFELNLDLRLWTWIVTILTHRNTKHSLDNKEQLSKRSFLVEIIINLNQLSKQRQKSEPHLNKDCSLMIVEKVVLETVTRGTSDMWQTNEIETFNICHSGALPGSEKLEKIHFRTDIGYPPGPNI